MTSQDRQALRKAVSEARRRRVRRSGSWESDYAREEAERGIERRMEARYGRRIAELEAERDRLRAELAAARAGMPAYVSEAERLEARRRSWRESKRRAAGKV